MTTTAAATGRAADDLRALVRRVEELAAASAADAWSVPPPSGGWSASACLEHLSVTAEVGISLLEAARGVPGRTLHRPGARWWVRLFARTLEPPARFKVRTKASFVPATVPPRDDVLARFARTHRQLADALEAVRGAELHRVTIDSPFGPLRYTPLEWGIVLAAHGRRHVWQAERALETRAGA